MAIVITDGTYYICLNPAGKHRKTKDISEAIKYENAGKAISYMNHAPVKTQKCYVYDTLENKVLWKHLTTEEKVTLQEEKIVQQEIKRCKNGKIKRKHYSPTTRKLIYSKYDGRCQLCGRKILLEEATLDHIKPLSMGGVDDVENIWITCLSCNRFKANILPEDFQKRITMIYRFQMEKKYTGSWRWKTARRMIDKLEKIG